MSATRFQPRYEKLPWRYSQADFVAFIEEISAVHVFRKDNVPLTEEETGDLFMLVFDVEYLYPDFRSLRTAVQPGEVPSNVRHAFLKLIMENLTVDQALDGVPVTRSVVSNPDDELARVAFAQDLVERLGPYVD